MTTSTTCIGCGVIDLRCVDGFCRNCAWKRDLTPVQELSKPQVQVQAQLLHHLIGFPVRSTDGAEGFVTEVYPHNVSVCIDATQQIKRTNPVAAYGAYGRNLSEITHYHLDTFLSKAPATLSDVEFEAKIAQSNTLRQIAILRVVQYTGNNSFYQSLQQQLLDKSSLSVKQMRAVLRDLLREYRTAQLQAPKATTAEYVEALHAAEQRSGIHRSEPTPIASPFAIDLASIPMEQGTVSTYLPNGFYTVVYNDAGEYRTFKVTDADWANGKPAGTQAVYYLSGPDNSNDYTFYAFLIGREFKPTHKLRNAHDLSFALIKLLAPDAFMLAGKTFAMRANVCFVCRKKLTTPTSAAAGIGPDCAKNIGVDQVALAALNVAEKRAEQTRKQRADAQAGVDELFPE